MEQQGVLIGDIVRALEQFASSSSAVAVLWATLLLLVLFWGTMSFILAYHWRAYSFSQMKMRLPRRLYFIGSAVLLLMMLGALLAL